MTRQIKTTIFLGAIAVSLLLLCQPAAALAQSVETVPVYRFAMQQASRHYYSTNPTPKFSSDRAEGISYYISPRELPYTVPLYELDGRQNGDRLYTIDASERDAVLKSGYLLRGILGYVLPPTRDLPGTAPLHRWAGHPDRFLDHLYAATKPNVPGYTYEGEAARVWTEPVKLPQRLVELIAPAAGATIQINSNPVFNWRVWSKGGSIRLSYSPDNGESWRPIATVPNNGVYGQLNNQSFNGWKVPPEAGGTIVIKADWIKGGLFGTQLPWATDSKRAIKVPAIRDIRIPPRISRP